MSNFNQQFIVKDLKSLTEESKSRKDQGWRYVQTLAVKVDDGVDLIYSFMKDGQLDNLKICSIKEADVVHSITDNFIEAFVWENEIHDLFNITFKDIAIDFGGSFYNVAVDAPFTVISKEALDRKEKQAKINAAIAAKKAKAAAQSDKPKPVTNTEKPKAESSSSQPKVATEQNAPKDNINANKETASVQNSSIDTSKSVAATSDKPDSKSDDKKEGEGE